MAASESITIRYDVSIDDLIAFNVSFSKTSRTVQAMNRKLAMVALPVIFLIVFGLGTVSPHRSYWDPLIVATLNTGLMAIYLKFIHPKVHLNWLRSMVRKMYSEGQNPGLVGEHLLETDEQGFMDRTTFRESRYAWGALVRIESEPGYTYLYTSATSAFVIPHRSITDGDFPRLLEQVKLHYKPDAKLTA